MRRRDFINGSTAAIAIGALIQPTPLRSQTAKPLNLLFITADDMNYSLPGFMGSKYNLSPSLDALANRSHRFVNNHAAAPICQPSRSAMMTGRVPHHSGALGFNPVYEGVPTLTTILKARNYYTAAIHKIEHMQPESCFPWDHAALGRGRNPNEYAIAVGRAITRARELNRPFFINCNINDPHRPFYGSPQAMEMDYQQTGEYKVPRELRPEDVEVPSFLENLPDVRKEFSQYCNSARRMDISIGRVLDVLRGSSEADNTIVLFTADHGMPFPFSKATVYRNGTSTPVLVSWPGMARPRVFEQLTSNIDILPTLLDLLKVAHPNGIDGRSWMGLIQGRSEKGREYVVTHVNTVASGMAFPMRAIQDKRYSLVFSPWSDGKLEFQAESMSGLTFNAMKQAAESNAGVASRVKQYIFGFPLAFYDLETDPDQRVNQIDTPGYRKAVGRMKELLLAYMEEGSDPQLDNFKTLLAGGTPVVKQPPRRTAGPE